MILAVDTATKWTGLALYDGSSVIAENGWRSFNTQTVDLAPAAAEMLIRAGVSSDDLSAVAVAIGPGSYTGLRIGLGFAKGLVLASRAKLIGISTLDIIAASAGVSEGDLVAVVEAGRTRICAGQYKWRGSKGWQSADKPDIYDWEDLLDAVEEQSVFAGEIDSEAAKMIKAAGKDFKIIPAVKGVRRAGFLAEIAWRRFRRGETDEPNTLVPIYLRDPSGAVPDTA